MDRRRSIDASAALAMPGVVSFISAKDITPAQNTWGPEVQDEEIFASTSVSYCGTRSFAVHLAKLLLIHPGQVKLSASSSPTLRRTRTPRRRPSTSRIFLNFVHCDHFIHL
jgi:hypothetical protein